MSNELISRDYLLENHVQDMYYPLRDGTLTPCKAILAAMVKSVPQIQCIYSFDLSANSVLDESVTGHALKFRETDEICPQCQHDLEVYYCENCTYAVRCKHCKTVTLVQARNYDEAAKKVGLHVKTTRHGRWERRKHRIFGNTYDYECSICGCDYALAEYNFCPDCGTKMEGDTDG